MLSSYGTVRKSRSATNSPGGAVRDALARQHAKYLKQRLSQKESGSQRESHTAVPSLKELSYKQLQFNPQQQPGYIHMDPRLKDMLISFQEEDSDDSDENVNEEVISEFFKSALIDDKQGMDRKALVEKVTGKLDEARNTTPKFPLRPESEFNRKYFVFEHGDESSKANPSTHTSINNKTPEFELETGQTSKPQETSSSPQTLDTGHDNPNKRHSGGVKVEKEGLPGDAPMFQPLTFELQKDKSQESLLEDTSFCAPASLDTGKPGKDNTDNSLKEFFNNSSKARDLVPKIYNTLECLLDIAHASRSKEASLSPTVSLDTGYDHPDGRYAEGLKMEKDDCSKVTDQVLVFGPEKDKLPIPDIGQASTIPETLSTPVTLDTGNGNSDQEKYKEIAEEDKISSATEGIPDMRQKPILESKEESSSSNFTLSKDPKTNMDFSDANLGPETKVDRGEVARATPDAQPAPEKESSILAPEMPKNEDLEESTELPTEDDKSPKQALEAPKTIETKPESDSEETQSREKKINFEWQVSIQAATIQARKSQYQASLDKCNENRDSVAKAKLSDIKSTIPGAIAKQKLASRWEKVLVSQASAPKPKDTDVKNTETCQKKELTFECNRPGIEREILEKPASLNFTKTQQVSSIICNLEKDAFHQHEKTSPDSKKKDRIVSGQEKAEVARLQHRISEYKRNLDLDCKRITRTVIASNIEHGVFNLQERVKMYHRSISPKEQNTASTEQLTTAASGVLGSPGTAKNSGSYKLAYEASLRRTQESLRSGSTSSDDNAAVRRERRKVLEQRWLCHNEKTTAEKESFHLEEQNTLADNIRHGKPFSETTQGEQKQTIVSENDSEEKKADLIDESNSRCGSEERESINGNPNVQRDTDCIAILSEEQATTDLAFNEFKESETEKKGSTEKVQAELNGTTSEASTVDKTVEKKTSSPRSATSAEKQSKSSKKDEVKTWNSILKQTNQAEIVEDMAEHRRVSLQERLFRYKENAKQLQGSGKAIKRTEQEIFSQGKEKVLYGANDPKNSTEEIELERSKGKYRTSTMHDHVILGKPGKSAEESLNSVLGNTGQGTSTLPHSWIKDRIEVGQGISTSPETRISTTPRNIAEFVNSESSEDEHRKTVTSSFTLGSKEGSRASEITIGQQGTSTLSVRRDLGRRIKKEPSSLGNSKVGLGTPTLPDFPEKDNNKVGHGTSTLPDSPDIDTNKVGHETSTLPDSHNMEKKVGHGTSTLPVSPNENNKKVGHGTSTLPDSPDIDNNKVGHGTSTLPDSHNMETRVGHGTSTLLDSPNKDKKKVGHGTSTLPDSHNMETGVGHGTSTLLDSPNKDKKKVGHGTSTLPDFPNKDSKKVGHGTSTLLDSPYKDKVGYRTPIFPNFLDKCNKRVGHTTSTLTDSLNKENSKIGHGTSILPARSRSTKPRCKVELMNPDFIQERLTKSRSSPSTNSPRQREKDALPEKTALPRWSYFKHLHSKVSKHRDSTIIVQEQNDPAVNGSKDKTSYSEVSSDGNEQTVFQTQSLLSFWKAKEALNMDDRKTSTILEKSIPSRLNNEWHMDMLASGTSILADMNKLPNKKSSERSKAAPARPIFAGAVRSPTNRSKSPKMGKKDNDRKSPTSPNRTVSESTYDQDTAILPGKTGICSLCNKNSPNSGPSKDGHGTSTLLEKIRLPKINKGVLKSELANDGQEISFRVKSSPRLGDIQKPSNSDVTQNVRGTFAENYGHGTSIARRESSPVKDRAGQNQSVDGSKISVLPEVRSKLEKKDTPVLSCENSLQTEIARRAEKTKSSSMMGKFTSIIPTLQERMAQISRSSGDQSCVRASPTENDEKPETMPTISKQRQLESSSSSVGHQLQQQKHKDKEAGRNDEKVDSKISKFEEGSASVVAKGSLSNFNTVTSTSVCSGIDTSDYLLPTFQRSDVPATRYRKANGLTYCQPNVSLNKRMFPPTETATPLHNARSEKESTKIDLYTRIDSTGLLSDSRPKNVPNVVTTTFVEIAKEKAETVDVSVVQISPVDKPVAVEGMETVCHSKAHVPEIHNPGPKTTEQRVVPTNVESGIPEKNTQSPKPIRNDVLTSEVGVDITETTKSSPKPTEYEASPGDVEVQIPETTNPPPNPTERDIISRNLEVNILEPTNLCSNPSTQEIVPSKRKDNIQETTNPTEEDAIPSRIEFSTPEATKSWSEHTNYEVGPTKLEENISEMIDSCANSIKSEDVPKDTSEVNSISNTETIDTMSQSDMNVLPKESSEQVSSSAAATESIQETSSCQSQEVDVIVRTKEIHQKTDAISLQTVHDEEDCFFDCIESEDEEDCKKNLSKVDAPFFCRQLSSFERQIEQTNTLGRSVFYYFCLLLLIVGFLLPVFYQHGHLIFPPEPEPEPEPSILWNILSFLLPLE